MTAFNSLLEIAKLIGETFDGAASADGAAGKTTTVDTNQVSTVDDYFNGGTIFFRSGANLGASAVITDYVNQTRTWTHAAQTGQVAAGVLYTVCRPTYTREALFAALNMALQEVGELTQSYINSAVPVTAGKQEVTIAASTTPARVVRVEVSTQTSDPYGWKRNLYWEQDGTKIVFKEGKGPQTTGQYIKVFYTGPHAVMSTDAGVISSFIYPLRLHWTAACFAVENRLRMVGKDDPKLAEWLKNVGYPRRNEMILRYPIRNMPRDPILSGVLS